MRRTIFWVLRVSATGLILWRLALSALGADPPPPVHPMVVATANGGTVHYVSGIQPLCPASQSGWVVTFEPTGFRAQCDRNGPQIFTWDTIQP